MGTLYFTRHGQRMIFYLSHYSELPEGEIVDEMLAILSDRNQIMQKKQLKQNDGCIECFVETPM